jgi:hypothetical protein
MSDKFKDSKIVIAHLLKNLLQKKYLLVDKLSEHLLEWLHRMFLLFQNSFHFSSHKNNSKLLLDSRSM